MSVLAAGCSRPAPNGNSEGLHASLISPSDPEALKNTTLSLNVVDTSGRPAHLDDVVISLTMTTMMMPPNIVCLHEAKPGLYTGAGTFTMGGKWQASASAHFDGKNLTLGDFPVTVKD